MEGVKMIPPPSQFMESVNRQINLATSTLKSDENGAIVGVATDKGTNLAIVARVNSNFQVVSWVGKTWGNPIEGGTAVRVAW